MMFSKISSTPAAVIQHLVIVPIRSYAVKDNPAHELFLSVRDQHLTFYLRMFGKNLWSVEMEWAYLVVPTMLSNVLQPLLSKE